MHPHLPPRRPEIILSILTIDMLRCMDYKVRTHLHIHSHIPLYPIIPSYLHTHIVSYLSTTFLNSYILAICSTHSLIPSPYHPITPLNPFTPIQPLTPPDVVLAIIEELATEMGQVVTLTATGPGLGRGLGPGLGLGQLGLLSGVGVGLGGGRYGNGEGSKAKGVGGGAQVFVPSLVHGGGARHMDMECYISIQQLQGTSTITPHHTYPPGPTCPHILLFPL